MLKIPELSAGQFRTIIAVIVAILAVFLIWHFSTGGINVTVEEPVHYQSAWD